MEPLLQGLPRGLGLLWSSSWQAAVLVPVVLVAQRLLRGGLTPGWRHALWWIVLGRLLIPIPPPSAWSVFNWLPRSVNQDFTANGFSQPESEGRPGRDRARPVSPPLAAPADRWTVSVRPGLFVQRAVGRAAGTPRTGFGRVLLGLWVAGSFLLLARFGWRNWKFAARVCAQMRPASPEIQRLFEECRRAMSVRRKVEVLEGELVDTPAVFGLFRPRLLLPRRLASALPAESLRHVFWHELAHVRRGDLLVHGLVQVLSALHWFNPVLPWAFRRLRADREQAADALALGCLEEEERRDYGLTIVNLLQGWSGPSRSVGTVGILEDGVWLERRIRAIASYRRPSRWSRAMVVPLATLAAISWTGAQTRVPVPEATQNAAPTPSSGASKIYFSAERQRIQTLLGSIRVPEVHFDGLPLEVMLRELKALAKSGDSAGRGINFFINPDFDAVGAVGPVGPTPIVDPLTGKETPPSVRQPELLGQVRVRVDPPLRDVTLAEVLSAMTLSTATPIRCTVEDSGVVFAFDPPPEHSLVTRVLGVNVERLGWGVDEGSRVREFPLGESARGLVVQPSIQSKVRKFFHELGVRLEPPNFVFLHDQLGLLMVRLTSEEAEVVEGALADLRALRRADTILAEISRHGTDLLGPIGTREAELPQFDLYAKVLARFAALQSQYPADAEPVRTARKNVEDMRAQLLEDVVVVVAPAPFRKAEDIDHLRIDREGRWWLNGRVLDRTREVAGALPVFHDTAASERPLRIVVDPGVAWSEVVKAFELARAKKLKSISAAVEPAPPDEAVKTGR